MNRRYSKYSNLSDYLLDLLDVSDKIDIPPQKLKLLIEYNDFYLPMASAILSVLYPNSFSIYDYRVCDELQKYLETTKYHRIKNCKFERLWDGYEDSLEKVILISGKKTYREADNFLWGKSFYDQLFNSIGNRFLKA